MDSHDIILNEEVLRCDDDQLIAGLQWALRKQRGMTARLIAFIAEVDARGLYRDHAHSSMFSYAVHELQMSEDEASARIGAARMCRAYPVVLGMLARGELHLSGVRQLSSVMTPDNHLELLALARFKSRRAIERLLAERFPKPDVRNEMRKLPSRLPAETPAPGLNLSLEPALEHAETLQQPGSLSSPAPRYAALQTASLPSPASNPALTPAASVAMSMPNQALSPATSGSSGAARPVLSAASAVPGLHAGSRTPNGSMSPLRSDRYRVQFTASQQLHDKIEQAQHLLRHQIPNGDIAEICERALDLLLAEQMKERYGVGRKPRATKSATPCETATPRETATPCETAMPSEAATPRETATQSETATPCETATQSETANPGETANPSETATPKPPQRESRHIPHEIRRQVFARDGGQCTFRSADGKRCQERGRLQFHHQDPYALGGKATLANICLRCTCHNLLDAERDFGRAFMRRRIAEAVAKRAQNDPPRDGLSAHPAAHR